MKLLTEVTLPPDFPVNNSLHEQEQSSVKRVVLRVVAGRICALLLFP